MEISHYYCIFSMMKKKLGNCLMFFEKQVSDTNLFIKSVHFLITFINVFILKQYNLPYRYNLLQINVLIKCNSYVNECKLYCS